MKNIIFMILILISILSSLQSRVYEDMLGEKIEIKNDILKIHAATPTILYTLYAIDKEKIAGLNFPFHEGEAKYLDPKVVNLPVLGGWFGQGRTPNGEMILQVQPDLILLSDYTKKMGEKKIKNSLGDTNIPLVYIKSNSLEELVESFSYIGKLINKESRAKKLEEYGKGSLSLSKEILKKISQKPKVYYAEGKNGLQTECHSSLRSEIITLAGGENVHKCTTNNQFGREMISFEKVLSYNPEVIFIYDKRFYTKIYQNKNWKHIDAVKNKQVYLLPKGPFNWFDRPPSFMRLLGLKWVISILHPELYTFDIYTEAKLFYKLFLDIDLSVEQLNEIMGDN